MNAILLLYQCILVAIIGKSDAIAVRRVGDIVGRGGDGSGIFKKIPFIGCAVEEIAGSIDEVTGYIGGHFEAIRNNIVESKKIKTGGHFTTLYCSQTFK